MSKKGGHHGGAWKVAYADFVTAMMALFLVLWLSAQDEKIKEAVERAFKNPFASITKENVGIIPNKENQAVRDKSGNFDSSSAVELQMLRRINEDLIKSLKAEDEDPKTKPVELDLSPDGLRISIFDRSRRPIFEPQSVKFTQYGEWVFTTLAWEVARYKGFTIELEGHTEAGHPPPREEYDNWELSADRANVSRRKLLDHGVGAGQIRKVAGYSDTMPMEGVEPTDEANCRVTVMLKINSHDKNSQNVK
ncbi:MAG: flagellar motor protein MotB [Pedosphaera sp.]|nr:flagellar motor protein MotB [Pedosphaera sp.]